MPSVTKMWTWLFGKSQTPQEAVRANTRLINKAIRNIERERYNMDKQEQKQILEIKRMAARNQPEVVKTMANDLVRIRGHLKKLLKMKQNLQGVQIQLQTLETQQNVTRAVYNATIALRTMNKQMNMPRIRMVLKEFEKQNEIMGVKEEMINETMDDAAGFEDDGEESSEIVAQVLDELGIQITQQLPEAPSDAKKNKTKSAVLADAGNAQGADAGSSSFDDELLARLENLRKN